MHMTRFSRFPRLAQYCRLALAVLLPLALTAPAAADLEQARQAYRAGDWQTAVEAARSTNDADGLALASRAVLAQLMIDLDHPDRAELAEQGIDLAEAALDRDATHVEARLNLAGALGYQGRYMSGWRAYVSRVPQRGRRILESVVADAPENAWAHGMLGAWHLEVARRGGSRGMRALGASVEAGLDAYNQAIALDPADPALRYFLALGLIALDAGDAGRDAWFALGRDQLEAALTLDPRDALEAAILDEARALRDRLDDRRAAARWADRRMRR